MPSGSWQVAVVRWLPRSVSSASTASPSRAAAGHNKRAPTTTGATRAPAPGTGPRALAHALLTYELGSEIADAAARAFEQEVIAELPRDRGGEEWTLTGQQVRDWWHTRRLLADVLAPLEAADRLQEPPDDDDDPIPDEKDMMDEHEEPGVIPAWELQELLQRTQAQGRRGALDLLRALVEAGVMDEKQRAAAEQALRHRWQEIDEARAP